MIAHPYQDFADYAATLAPGQTVTYYLGPSLAIHAEANKHYARVREGFLCLGTAAGEPVRPNFSEGKSFGEHKPPDGFGLGYLTQRRERYGPQKQYSRWAYRFTKKGQPPGTAATETARRSAMLGDRMSASGCVRVARPVRQARVAV